MTSRFSFGLAASLCLFPFVGAEAVLIEEDFNSGFSGWSNSGFFTADATGGVGGSGGVDFSTTTPRNRGANHPTAFSGSGTGHTITVRSAVQFDINGTALNDATAPNVNGINDPFVGLRVSTTPEWFSGTNLNFYLAKRFADNGFWGVRVPGAPFIEGFVGNQELGFDNNLGGAGSSDFFDIELVLTENGGFYDQQFNVYKPDGSLALATSTFASTLAAGTTLYGGWHNGFHADGDAVTLEQVSKVNSIKLDDFSISVVAAIPEPSAALFGALVAGGLGMTVARRR